MRHLFLALCLCTALSATQSKEPDTKYERVLEQIKAAMVDSSTVRQVSGIVIERGPLTIVIEDGTLAYLKPVNGRRIGVVVKGRALISFSPNLTTERTNMARFYPNESFIEDVTEVVIATTDEDVHQQIAEHPVGGQVAGLAELAGREWNKLVLQAEELEFDDALARTLLNNYSAPVLMCTFKRSDSLSGFVMRNPYEVEPYRLFLEETPYGLPRPTMVTQCPENTGLVEITDSGIDAGDLVASTQHTMSIDIDRSMDIAGRDRVDMTVLADSLTIVDVGLYPTLKIDSIRMPGFGALTFFRSKDGFTAWIELPNVLKKGEKFSLEFFYKGDVINRFRDYTVLVTSIMWYPAHSYKHKAFYDITFSYPESATVQSVGARSTMSTADGRTTARWITGAPIRNASFHIGFFRRETIEVEKGLPSTAVLYQTAEQVETVALDMKQSLEFFTKLYGPLTIDSLIGTELPGSHGEAFPGLLHLSWYAFVVTGDAETDKFFGEQFTSHEVAHQWWGIGVDFATYRDQWLSEGFAMYSCLLYSQLAAADNEKFFKLLEDYRTEITSFGKKAIGKDLAPPAIALGRRVNDGAPRGGAYNTFVYYKGAWILHMLRNMMLDLKTMKEDAFMTVMREFYMRHRGKRASTDDFQKTIEDVTGVNVQWFFNQWVYGNQIPTYTYAYKSQKQADGTYKNVLRVKQTGVPESFQMYVPIKVVLDDGTFARYRIVMKGAEATMDLPSSKSEIDELIFNDLASVLCETQKESF